MSKNLLIILKSNLFKVTFFIIAVFIYCKYQNLDNYNFYEGKIVGIDIVSIKKSSGRGRQVYIKMNIPNVEYYRKKDTVRCDQGETKMFTNFEINEKVVILENNEKPV